MAETVCGAAERTTGGPVEPSSLKTPLTAAPGFPISRGGAPARLSVASIRLGVSAASAHVLHAGALGHADDCPAARPRVVHERLDLRAARLRTDGHADARLVTARVSARALCVRARARASAAIASCGCLALLSMLFLLPSMRCQYRTRLDKQYSRFSSGEVPACPVGHTMRRPGVLLNREQLERNDRMTTVPLNPIPTPSTSCVPLYPQSLLVLE